MPTPEIHVDLRTLILTFAARTDVHSVSCQFDDRVLWEGLLDEQARRVRATGHPPLTAFFLCGPDAGLPGIAKLHPGLEDDEDDEDGQHPSVHEEALEERMGGGIHIPYEGVCGADLFVYPDWRRIYPETWQAQDAELDWATGDKPCNHLLIEQDLGEAPSANRIGPIAGGWWLYSSTAPYRDCNPFSEAFQREDPVRRIIRAARLRALSKTAEAIPAQRST